LDDEGGHRVYGGESQHQLSSRRGAK